ncbi:uncharacterized protein [Setaria viridis]|uniref:uncharacterized protein n=1 Tax=Setaria viridis TaxID=4556 RepID=UPI003B3AF2E5
MDRWASSDAAPHHPDNVDYGGSREEDAAEEGASDGGRREVAETWQRLAEVGQRRVPDAGAVQIGHRCRC